VSNTHTLVTEFSEEVMCLLTPTWVSIWYLKELFGCCYLLGLTFEVLCCCFKDSWIKLDCFLCALYGCAWWCFELKSMDFLAVLLKLVTTPLEKAFIPATA
jgi:hypothetical protein